MQEYMYGVCVRMVRIEKKEKGILLFYIRRNAVCEDIYTA